MNQGQTIIDYEQAHGKADMLRTSANKLDDILNNVKAIMRNVGNDDTWSSAAATEVIETFNRFSAKFPSFIQKVREFATALDNSVETFETGDSQIKNSAGQRLSN